MDNEKSERKITKNDSSNGSEGIGKCVLPLGGLSGSILRDGNDGSDDKDTRDETRTGWYVPVPSADDRPTESKLSFRCNARKG
jgi:hypothetical protein